MYKVSRFPRPPTISRASVMESRTRDPFPQVSSSRRAFALMMMMKRMFWPIQDLKLLLPSSSV